MYTSIMVETTVRLNVETKKVLDSFREYKGESYDELIRKISFISKLALEDSKAAEESMQDITKARDKIKSSGRYTKTEIKKILGEKYGK